MGNARVQSDIAPILEDYRENNRQSSANEP